jgi:diaminopimelate decarboxylase
MVPAATVASHEAGPSGAARRAARVIEILPSSARIERDELQLGGLRASELAERFGTPLVVYCEATLRERAGALRAAVGAGGRLAYGTKAFPNVALLRLLREEGIGADVASVGELAFAKAAALVGDELIVHGNNKDGALLAAAAAEGATVVLDAADEAVLAEAAGVQRVLVRVTLGVDADTHEAIRTGHHGSKFGLPTEQALELVHDARARGREVLGLHVHVGSQLPDFAAQEETIRRLAAFATTCHESLGWTARVADLGGGFGIRHHPDEAVPDAAELAAGAAATARAPFADAGLPEPEVWLEPGRSLVGRAGVTLYRVGAVKRLPGRTWVAVDGGMSDNPRPQLYGARYTALSASRAGEQATERVSIAGMHCESGDVLIDDVDLPTPVRGDLLAVPATGAYTLAMSSNYNGVPRPAAVLVANGGARLIRRRETVDDLLTVET